MKNIKVLVSLLIFLFIMQSCHVMKNIVLDHQVISSETDKVFDRIVEVRRDLHAYPELAGREKRTQETIVNYLVKLGLEVRTDIYGYGVVGILKGAKEGRKIAWRADMDGLPNELNDDVAFASKVEGLGHGCGHDVHVAIGLGIAEVLSKYKSSLSGTIYFIFQPEEETFIGAKRMIENGLLSSIKPDEIFGLHVCALPVGKVMVKPNEMYAYQKIIEISLKNNVSKKEAKDIYEEIKNKMTRLKPESEPWLLQNVIDPNLGLASPNTIYEDYLFMDANALIHSKDDRIFIRTALYETNKENVKNILPEMEKQIFDGKHKDSFLSISYVQENPTIDNNEQLTRESIAFLSSTYGQGFVLPDYGQVPYFNDDFCYFQQKVPGVYFLLGGSNFEKGIIAMNHTPDFKVDEDCIRVGVES